jgi:hypothetical protein
MGINGMGGVMMCATTSRDTTSSHPPWDLKMNKERYVFFAMPNIAVDISDKVNGVIHPERVSHSCACGTLLMLQPKFEEHHKDKCDILDLDLLNSMDPKYSNLEVRMSRSIRPDEIPKQGLSLKEVSQLCDRVVRKDLNACINANVDPSKVNYVVVTGVQIHSHNEKAWHPNMEYVCLTSMYAVRDSVRFDIDVIMGAKQPTPRQFSHNDDSSSNPFGNPGGMGSSSGSCISPRGGDCPCGSGSPSGGGGPDSSGSPSGGGSGGGPDGNGIPIGGGGTDSCLSPSGVAMSIPDTKDQLIHRLDVLLHGAAEESGLVDQASPQRNCLNRDEANMRADFANSV